MYHDGILVGVGSGYFPNSSLTRAEGAALIIRVIDKSRRVDVGDVPALPIDGLEATGSCGQLITVTSAGLSEHEALVNVYEQVGGVWLRKFKDLPAGVGSRGMMYNRRQNTNKSPAGIFGFVFAFGIMENPGMSTAWEYRTVTEQSYWVLDSSSPLYNRWSEGNTGFDDSEHLMSFGSQYNYALVIDFNYHSPVKGDGGAIFMHVATGDGKGTAGCVALAEADLLGIMGWIDIAKNPKIIICPEADLPNF